MHYELTVQCAVRCAKGWWWYVFVHGVVHHPGVVCSSSSRASRLFSSLCEMGLASCLTTYDTLRNARTAHPLPPLTGHSMPNPASCCTCCGANVVLRSIRAACEEDGQANLRTNRSRSLAGGKAEADWRYKRGALAVLSLLLGLVGFPCSSANVRGCVLIRGECVG